MLANLPRNCFPLGKSIQNNIVVTMKIIFSSLLEINSSVDRIPFLKMIVFCCVVFFFEGGGGDKKAQLSWSRSTNQENIEVYKWKENIFREGKEII